MCFSCKTSCQNGKVVVKSPTMEKEITKKWEKWVVKFKDAKVNYRKNDAEPDSRCLRPYCRDAGKEFFKLIIENKLNISMPEEFKIKPIGGLSQYHDGTVKNATYFAEYWICVLSHLHKVGEIHITNNALYLNKLPMHKGKVDWMGLSYDSVLMQNYFRKGKEYTLAICDASIQVCEFTITSLEHSEDAWPPQGYISKTEICDQYKVPRTTLQGWQKKDGIKPNHHPSTYEDAYPEDWFFKHYTKWSPRKSKTDTLSKKK